MNTLRLSFAPALLALSTLPMGCASEPVDPMAPIASVALTNGNLVEFYEPSPGSLFVSEAGIVGAAPTRRDGRTPLELYRDLAPDRPVPEALAAAQARSEALGPETIPASAEDRNAMALKASVTEPKPLGFIANQSCDDQWFNTNFCNDSGSPDWQMCLLNHWNGAWAQQNSVDNVLHTVCADIGTVTLKVQMGDGGGGIWSIPEGSWRSFGWWDQCTFGCNTSTRGDILDASNDRFHYSVSAWF